MEVLGILVLGVVFILALLLWSAYGYSNQCPGCKRYRALTEVGKQQHLGSPEGVYVVLYQCIHCNHHEMKVEDRRSHDYYTDYRGSC